MKDFFPIWNVPVFVDVSVIPSVILLVVVGDDVDDDDGIVDSPFATVVVVDDTVTTTATSAIFILFVKSSVQIMIAAISKMTTAVIHSLWRNFPFRHC